MARSTGNSKSSRTAGVLVVLCVWLALMATIWFKGCNGPSAVGERLMDSDPRKAAELFSIDARADSRHSINSMVLLTQIKDPNAIYYLIDLLDLPDGHYANANWRAIIYGELAKRTQSIGNPHPMYYPAASLEDRRFQKAAWLAWWSVNQGELSAPTLTKSR